MSSMDRKHQRFGTRVVELPKKRLSSAEFLMACLHWADFHTGQFCKVCSAGQQVQKTFSRILERKRDTEFPPKPMSAAIQKAVRRGFWEPYLKCSHPLPFRAANAYGCLTPTDTWLILATEGRT